MEFPIFCVDCDAEIDEEWYWAKRSQAGRRCRTCGPPHWRSRNKRYRQENWDKVKKTREQRIDQHRAYIREWGVRKRDEARALVLAAYGPDGKAACHHCGLDELIVLDLDHVNGGGKEHRERLSKGKGGDHFYRALVRVFEETGEWPRDVEMQTLCANCHVRKDRLKMRDGRA